jgi:hypothetical protein
VTFYSVLALAVGLLVVAPYLAHRLRRRSAEERPFPPARLVQPAPPKARRRALLEDKALYVTRAAAVVALALLGATPFVRCSRLSLQRAGGASVAMAIVLDDSMSMRADAAGRPRFVRAREGARELLSSARDGDEVAIVLAGAPARVALAATTDLAAARETIDATPPSDRATDLDGALVLARGLISSLPQLDRRIVVLSDLADGQPEGPPLGESSGVPVWVALPELRARGTDCALLRADQHGAHVRVAIACGPGGILTGREVVVEDAAGKALGRASPANAPSSEVVVTLPSDSASAAARARLSGADAIAVDDVAPVVSEAGRGGIAVVADSADEAVATGGAPIVEQALSALKLDLEVRPIPALPDRLEDLAGEVGVLLDDPPGLTPEQRHALGAFVEGGGLALLALGPHAAAAPLGATLEPVLAQSIAWKDAARVGADPKSAVGVLLGSAAGLADLGASWRAVLAPEDAAAFEPIMKWTDGAPLVARRAMGRGEIWIVTLPFSADASDLPLRPAFLALLDAWVRTARDHAAPRRSDVGTAWKFPGARNVKVRGPAGPIAETREDGVARVTAPLVGPYEVSVDRKTELRVAAPDVREIDLRPRALAEGARGAELGERRAAVDISGQVALALLALMCLEMVLRVVSKRRAGAVET